MDCYLPPIDSFNNYGEWITFTCEGVHAEGLEIFKPDFGHLAFCGIKVWGHYDDPSHTYECGPDEDCDVHPEPIPPPPEDCQADGTCRCDDYGNCYNDDGTVVHHDDFWYYD